MLQLTILASSTDDTSIEAELERTSQYAKFVLKRTFSAPRSLAYTAETFQGDMFVKTNIIARFLQSDVDRVEKEDGLRVAIVESNYKFSFRKIENLEGQEFMHLCSSHVAGNPVCSKGKSSLMPKLAICYGPPEN